MDNLPIARRTRSSSRLSEAYAAGAEASTETLTETPTATPRRRPQAKKRVRFSDPGPALVHEDDTNAASSSTGLTPMIRRTTLLGKAMTPSKRRRHSTPAVRPSGNGMTSFLNLDSPAQPFSGAVTFLPLRQVLDGRVKRRLRRNGLSEEMNRIQQEKRQRAREARAEVERLRAEVAARDAEIVRLQDSGDDTIIQDNERILDLEREVEELQQQLSGTQVPPVTPEADRTYNWTLAARDPFSRNDDGAEDDDETIDMMGLESPGGDEHFGDMTMAELQCGTPTRARKEMSVGQGSFPTPPATSPAGMPGTPMTPVMPVTPVTPMMGRFAAEVMTPLDTPTTCHAEVQAALPDEEKEKLRADLAAMETYRDLVMRLEAQLPEATAGERLEDRVTLLLRALDDKTAALTDLSTNLAKLEFAGSDAAEHVSALGSAFRAARLELEYLTPGEIALPLNAPAAEVLDLLLDKLRSLGRQTREADQQIDEYHELERSLRQQLGARVETMDGLVKEVRERDARIAELEIGADRLKGALASYARDVSELEALVQRVEGELKEREGQVREKEAALQEKDVVLQKKDAALQEKDEQLEEAVEAANQLRQEMAEAEARTSQEKAAAQEALAFRDARVDELRDEVERVNAALRTAHETVQQLRLEGQGLEARLGAEQQRARSAAATLAAELARVGAMSRQLLGLEPVSTSDEATVVPGPFVEAPKRRSIDGDAVDPQAASQTKRRRRYDSGLGFLEEEAEQS